MKNIENCSVGIVGLGLMGGAFAIALRKIGVARITACDIDKEPLKLAKKEGVIDAGFVDPAKFLPECDLIFLSIAPSSVLKFMDNWMNSFKPGTLITDIAGTKANIAEKMEKSLRTDLDFVPAHPMAGSEKGGYIYAKSCIFQGKNYIFTPIARNKPENIAFLKDVVKRMGFTRITETTPLEHDRNIAFTSQLCHVIAAALIDCEQDTAITRFGGGSFEDLTRIAMLNAPLWTELFLENSAALIERMKQFSASFEKIKTLINEKSAAALEEILFEVRRRRSNMA